MLDDRLASEYAFPAALDDAIEAYRALLDAFSPGLDMTRTGESMDTKAGLDPFFTRESLGYATD